MKEHFVETMPSSVTEEQRRYGQKDQDLVYNGFSGNDTSGGAPPYPSRFRAPRGGKGVAGKETGARVNAALAVPCLYKGILSKFYLRSAARAAPTE